MKKVILAVSAVAAVLLGVAGANKLAERRKERW